LRFCIIFVQIPTKMQNANPEIRISKGDFYLNKGLEFTLILANPLQTFIYQTDNEHGAFEKLSEGQQAFLLYYDIDWQIRDSGIIYYFDRENGSKLPAVISAMQYFGEHEAAALLETALPLFKDYQLFYIDGNREREMPSGIYSAYADLDEEYMEMADEILERIEQFIRNNSSRFATDEDGNTLATNYSGACTTLHPDGTIKERFTLLDSIPDGTYEYFHENGILGQRKTYINGSESPEIQTFREDGSPLRTVSITADPNIVERTDYYENRQPARTELFSLSDEELSGPFKEWYSNGQIKYLGTHLSYYDYDGEFLSFYEDGSKKEESFYEDSMKNAINYWNEKGEQLLKNGTGTTVSSSINEVDGCEYRFETPYINGKKTGTVYGYIDGILFSAIDFVDGIQHGFSRSFYKNGNMKVELIMENGSWQKRKKFPLAKKIRVAASISCEMEDIMLTNRGLRTADVYPVATNAEEIAATIQPEISLFKGYDHDYTMDQTFLLSIDKDGIVTEVKFIGGSNAHLVDSVKEKIMFMKFLPGKRNEDYVASYSLATVQYNVCEI